MTKFCLFLAKELLGVYLLVSDTMLSYWWMPAFWKYVCVCFHFWGWPAQSMNVVGYIGKFKEGPCKVQRRYNL